MDPQPQLHLGSLFLDLLRLFIWLAILVLVFVPLEKFWPLHPHKLFRKAFGTDLVYYFLSGLVPKLLLTLPISLLTAWLHDIADSHDGLAHGYYVWTSGLPIPVRLIAALVVGEMGAYWAHRWSHQIPFLWRFHAVHHSAEEIDWLVNSRAHPVDMAFTRLCALIPMYVLGLAQPMGGQLDLAPLLITVLGVFWGFFIHANLKWRFGWLEWVVSSPAFHHWHHTNDGPDRINKNYSSMLPFVDRVFGTFFLPQAQWPERYGIDETLPAGIVGQLLHPLSASARAPASVESQDASNLPHSGGSDPARIGDDSPGVRSNVS